MGSEVDYLYGDSTPSPLKTNFIALLRDMFDFAVDVLIQEDRATSATQDVARLSEATENEVRRAEQLAAEVSQAIDRAAVGDGDSIAARCAGRIRHGTQDLVRSETDAARAVVAMEKARAAQVALSAQGACARAFETLALRQDLPDTATATKLWVEAASHYVVRLHGQTSYGLRWIIDLEVPPSHALAGVLRVERLVERLDVEAPEATGWIHKEVKLRPQRLDRLYLTELAVDPARTTMKLRASPDAASAGFDVSFDDESSRVELLRVAPGGAAPDAPHDVTGEDAAKLQSLRDGIVAMLSELADHKQSLVAASLDQTPLHQLETPRVLVERLIASAAPTVEQISRRSLVPGELTLKRVLSETQREEVFVSKTELLRKLEPLPMAQRAVFYPFKLWETHGDPASEQAGPVASPEPAPAPAPRVPGEIARPAATPRAPARENKSPDPVAGPARLSAGALRIRDEGAEGDMGGPGSTGKWPALHPV